MATERTQKMVNVVYALGYLLEMKLVCIFSKQVQTRYICNDMNEIRVGLNSHGDHESYVGSCNSLALQRRYTRSLSSLAARVNSKRVLFLHIYKVHSRRQWHILCLFGP